MGDATSPNDPVFFLHHCNVDRLWAQWWSDNPKRPYLPADGEPLEQWEASILVGLEPQDRPS